MSMEVVDPRAALLSNYEVLTLLREMEADHLIRTKAALRVKKDDEAHGGPPILPGFNPMVEASENLRTIEVEAIQYLAADYLPTTSQTEAGIAKLIKGLASYEFTKAEKLQIVNLAPTLAVELYVIVEELEDRLGEKMEDVLELVKGSLSSPSGASAVPQTNGELIYVQEATVDEQWNEDAEGIVEDQADFVDAGEGAGIEGDLDMEED
ncbi:RNA polymerase Rpb4-domain-containing protein [Cyathus striatus]|nr:RNA polymerase Rpb4-domain-containing protein [Cyathus striatus]